MWLLCAFVWVTPDSMLTCTACAWALTLTAHASRPSRRSTSTSTPTEHYYKSNFSLHMCPPLTYPHCWWWQASTLYGRHQSSVSPACSSSKQGSCHTYKMPIEVCALCPHFWHDAASQYCSVATTCCSSVWR